MDAVGSGGERLGTVGHNRREPRRDGPAAGDRHRRLEREAIASVDGDTARLSMPASQTRRSWRSEAPSPAAAEPSGTASRRQKEQMRHGLP